MVAARSRGEVVALFAWALACCLTAVFVAHALVDPRGANVAGLPRDVVDDAPVVIGAGLCLLRALVSRRERWLWSLLGLAFLAWAAGSIYSQAIVSHQDPVPYPSGADAFWLSFYPLVYLALALLLRSQVGRSHPSLWLDGLVGALGVAALAAAFIAPQLKLSGLSTSAVATSLAYPLGDVLLLAFVALLCALSGWRPSRALALLALAFSVQVATDAWYLYEVAEGEYLPGGILDAGWLVVVLLCARAAWLPPRPSRGQLADGPELIGIPAVFMTMAVSVLVYCSFTAAAPATAALATAALLLAALRLALTLRESRRLADLARRDPLTGLFNHGEFHSRLQRMAALGQHTGVGFSVALIDLDGFKGINDLYGHAEGDRILKEVAAAIQASTRHNDAACRVGGDEFALLLPGAEHSHARHIVERVQGALDGASHDIGISHGIAQWPQDGQDKDALLLHADLALYTDKRSRQEHNDPHRSAGGSDHTATPPSRITRSN
jgi:diguanylate cyclase